MAIRVIEVPSSGRFDPPPHPSIRMTRRRTDDPMPIGPLGMSEEEIAEALARARSAPVPDEGGAAKTLPLWEALLRVWADHKKPARPGPNSKTDDDFLLTLECLKDTKGKEREGRELFVKRVKVKDSIEAASASKRFTAAMKRVRALKLTFFERG
jgi:hypothetical protein